MRADARRNGERLLAAADAAFAEHGAEAALDDVARRAGVGIGTLYRHFPTREALAVAVLEDRLHALVARAERLREARSPARGLATWLRALLRHATTYRGLAGTVTADLVCARSGVAGSCDRMVAAGGQLLARAQARGVVRRDASPADVIALVVAIAATATRNPGGAARAERLLALLLDGLRPR